MKPFVRYLWVLTAFGLGVGTLYWFIAHEVTGAVLLWAFGLMPLIVGLWALRHGASRNAPVAPEDDPNADPSTDAGTSVGSFPAVTVWPIFFVLGLLLAGAGLIYGLILVPPGLALAAFAIHGLMRESRQ
ncbi:MAG: cytochrome c oxidase subunit 4 [Actinomycetota bacterium]